MWSRKKSKKISISNPYNFKIIQHVGQNTDLEPKLAYFELITRFYADKLIKIYNVYDEQNKPIILQKFKRNSSD